MLEAQLKQANVRQAECANCGAVKVVKDTLEALKPQLNSRSCVSFKSLLEKQIDNTSDFEVRSCDECNVQGKFKTSVKAARLLGSTATFKRCRADILRVRTPTPGSACPRRSNRLVMRMRGMRKTEYSAQVDITTC